MRRAAILLALAAALASPAATARPQVSGAVRTAYVNPYRRSPYVGALSMDARTGRVLSADRADARAYPASVTKLMTAFIVLDDVAAGKVSLSDPVVASPTTTKADVWLRQPSCTGLKPGSKMTVDELLKALMVNSANDAAIFLAERCSGTTAAFVDRMNAKAASLGMADTAYYNPNGLPPPPTAKERKFNVSTCYDLAKLARALLSEHPEILKYTSLKTWHPTCLGVPITDAKSGKPITWVNHNNVMVKDKLKVFNPDGKEASDGLKTGYIDAGGSSVILTGVRNGRRAIVVVLGSASSKERDEAARNLLSDALDSFSL